MPSNIGPQKTDFFDRLLDTLYAQKATDSCLIGIKAKWDIGECGFATGSSSPRSAGL